MRVMGAHWKKLALILALVGLALSGCSVVEVLNLSEVSVRVLVTMPDSSGGHTRLVGSGETAEMFSSHGGAYTVTTLPNEEYRQLVLDVRDQLSRRLFEERASLSAAEVAELVQRITPLEAAVAGLAGEQGSCGNTVPDFGAATVTVVWDEIDGRWSLSCGQGQSALDE